MRYQAALHPDMTRCPTEPVVSRQEAFLRQSPHLSIPRSPTRRRPRSTSGIVNQNLLRCWQVLANCDFLYATLLVSEGWAARLTKAVMAPNPADFCCGKYVGGRVEVCPSSPEAGENHRRRHAVRRERGGKGAGRRPGSCRRSQTRRAPRRSRRPRCHARSRCPALIASAPRRCGDQTRQNPADQRLIG